MEQLQKEILGLMQIIIGGVISVVGAYATIYVKKAIDLAKVKASHMKDEQAKLKLNDTLSKIDDLIETNIISAENTLKPAILQAIADGKVDKSELNALSKCVNDNVLSQLGSDAVKIFNDGLQDTNGYITNRIERILAELKSADGTQVTKTIIPQVVKNETQEINEKLRVENEALKVRLNKINNALA